MELLSYQSSVKKYDHETNWLRDTSSKNVMTLAVFTDFVIQNILFFVAVPDHLSLRKLCRNTQALRTNAWTISQIVRE